MLVLIFEQVGALVTKVNAKDINVQTEVLKINPF